MHPSRRSRLTTRQRHVAYAALATADAVLAATGHERLRRLTKPALMPLLLPGRDRRTRTALLLGGAGDVALLGSGDAAFLTGLGAFFVGHLAWIDQLRRGADPRSLRHGSRAAVAGGYLVAFTGLNAYLWRRTGPHRLAVLGYSTVLLGTALAALRSPSPATAVGGGLFLASDSLIALEKFAGLTLPAHEAWVMGSYAAAQALLADGGPR
ncbi:MAG: lysoplasmalogenase [Kineosporiaceae bacterium]|nr:lysoplasmalogenase [Kineosporiaceae bacterium]